MAHPKTLPIVASMLLIGVVWAVFGRAVNTPFVFDDEVSVVKNASIVRLWPLVDESPTGGPLNPPKDTTTSGRPLVNLSLALNYHFGKLNPAGYHAFNIVVHILSTLLLMVIVQRILRLDYFGGRFDQTSGILAFLAALVWAVHPLETETVVYVTQRTELLVGFFYLATLYGSLRYWAADSNNARTAWLVLATLACLAGMACKEVMVTAPVVVLLFERTFISGSFRQALQRSWPLYVGLALGWVLLAALNISAPRSDSAGFHLGISAFDWWLTQSEVFWMYLKLAVWPWPLSIHYEMPYLTTLGAAGPWLVPTAILLVATIILLWRRNAIGFVSAWVLIILSPTLVVPIATEVAAERRMYLPLAALVTLLIAGGYWLAQQGAIGTQAADKHTSPARRPVIIVAAIALLLAIALGTISARRVDVYQSELSLWQNALASQPDDFFVRYNLGNELSRAGREPEALVQYQESLRLKSNYSDAHSNLGNTLLDSGRTDEAIDEYKEALRIQPNNAGAHNNLGKALAQLNKLPEAIAQYQEAIRLKPNFAEAHNNLGNALFKSNRPQEALAEYELALRLQPTYSGAHVNLAALLASMGRFPEAIEHYQAALQLKPENFDALANMALAYAAMNRPTDAIAAAKKAERLARSHGETALARQIETWLTQYRAQQGTKQNAPASSGSVSPSR